MQCPRCDTELDAADGFCRRCGAPQGSVQPPRPSPTSIDRRAWMDPGPTPRKPPSLLMTDHSPMITFGLLFGGIFGFVGTVIGVVFTAVGISGEQTFLLVGPLVWLVFGGIGYTSVGLAVRQVLRLRRLWQDGQLCEGAITEVARDRSIRVNGRSPLRVQYTWKDMAGSGEGTAHSWNPTLADLSPGAKIAVLIGQDDRTRTLAVLPNQPIGERGGFGGRRQNGSQNSSF